MAKKRKKPGKKASDPRFTAKTADRHLLYQYSVQNPDQEVEVIEEAFRERRGRRPLTLKEDFCGTALLCAEWVRSHKKRSAVGLDLDAEVLDWGRKHNLAPLGADQKRVKVFEQNVLDPVKGKFDVCVGMNFSYFLFTTRNALRSYFEAALRSIADDGILFLDCYGGWESQEVMEEEREIEVDGKSSVFTYIWHQAYFNPINGAATNHIHFEFNDGTKMREAFTYEWRLWTLPEIIELLLEAGFRNVDTVWEDEDEDGEDLGTHSVQTEMENQPGWLCYIVAEK
jgi:hypothetical protein